MAKIDSVNKYMEEYLAGKTPEQREKFMAKDVDHQYQSIMTWRYNMRRRNAPKVAKKTIAEEQPRQYTPLEIIARARATVEEGAPLKEAEVQELCQSIDAFKAYLQHYLQRCRREEIRALESRQEEIAARLRTLREQTQQDTSGMPSLFD